MIFKQISLFKEANTYNSFIRNYTYDIYINPVKKLLQVVIELRTKEKFVKAAV